MIALRIVSVATAMILGIVLATVSQLALPAPLLLTLSATGAAFSLSFHAQELRWKEWSPLLVVLAAMVFAAPLGYWRAMERLGPPRPGTLRHALAILPDGGTVGLRGQVASEPELRGNGWGEIDLKVDELLPPASHDAFSRQPRWMRLAPGKVLVRIRPPQSNDDAGLQALQRLTDPRTYGYRLEVIGQFDRPATARNPGDFDTAAYLLQNDRLAQIRCRADAIKILAETRGSPLTELALEVKRSFLTTYKSTVREPASRLVAGATLGARRALEGVSYRGRNIQQSFRHCGVGHVLAVSGLHVSIVAVLLYGLFHLAGFKPRQFTPFLIFFLLIFAILCGARPSAIRAVIMNAVTLVALAYFRLSIRHATFTGLALSSAFILFLSPIVLFSPGFLLSYGAVLSLVLIAPAVHRWSLRLRGFALLFTLAWFFILVAAFCRWPGFFMNGLHWFAILGTLWLAIALGGRLNERFPTTWRVGLETVPAALRFFICAQLAIQAGMMVPLSAWFFGQFPIAGIFVNLLAIPAIGVLIQVGLLTGLVGLIPIVGPYLALPLGAAATLCGEFFYWLVFAGQRAFPFPPLPKPSLAWMLCYYLALGTLLFSENAARTLQSWLYRRWSRSRHPGWLTGAAYALPLALVMAPLLQLWPRPEKIRRVTCFANNRYPIVTLISDRRSTLLINAGDAFTAANSIFHGLRSQEIVAVQKAVIAAPHPDAGHEGVAALSRKLAIRQCLVPIKAATADDFLRQLGDSYVSEAAAKGLPWATRYAEAYAALLAAAGEQRIPLLQLEPGHLLTWADAQADCLPTSSIVPQRFASSARTALLSVSTRGFRWLIITDTTPESLAAGLQNTPGPYDIVAMADLSSRRAFPRLLEMVAVKIEPQALVLCGKSPPEELNLTAWKREHPTLKLFHTPADGAIIATFQEDGAMELKGFASGRTLTLTRPRAL